MGVDLSTYGGMLRDPGYPGMIADLNPVTSESMTNESATPIEFGRAVARGAADDTCKPVGADTDAIIGISIRYAIRPANLSGLVLYSQYDTVPVAKEAFIWAIATEAVTRGDAVLSLTAGGGTLTGTTGGAVGAGRIAVPNAKWATTVAAGALGKIRIYG